MKAGRRWDCQDGSLGHFPLLLVQEIYMKIHNNTISRRLPLLPVFAALAMATASVSVHAEPPADVSKLVGTWNNVNTATGGFVRIQVSDAGTGVLKVQAFGACSPTPCDLGVTAGLPQSLSVVSESAEAFRATYQTGFSTIVISAQRIYDVNGGTFLRVTRHTNFAAGDTRKDYVGTEIFRR